jgi:hypothetical protein
MKKESDFVIYCMERYRYFKGLSGAMNLLRSSMSYMEVTALCTQRNQKQVISLTCLLSKENARRRLLCLVEASIHF